MLDAEPDYVGIVLLGRIDVHEPFVVRSAGPAKIRPGTTVAAVRAMFVGADPSASGHSASNGFVLGVCSKLPITGYGRTYPVEGLRLVPGDNVAFLGYITARSLGRGGFSGFSLDYERSGVRGKYEKAESEFLMFVREPGTPPSPEAEGGRCDPRSGASFTRHPRTPLRTPSPA